MAQDVTLGGDRLGSGNKQKIELHNYGMNSFNQEQDFKSSMAPGILYPFLKLIGTNHGTFDIDLDSFVRTLPTRGPLFGSFKLQIDLFSVPFRLYQGVLHNNPVELGLNMNQVYLPQIVVGTDPNKKPLGSNEYNAQVSETSLLKYLGISGLGTVDRSGVDPEDPTYAERTFNAIPILAYYDIFKCYYSNKQEENAYVIAPGEIDETFAYKITEVFNAGTNKIEENINNIQLPINYINWAFYINADTDLTTIKTKTYIKFKYSFINEGTETYSEDQLLIEEWETEQVLEVKESPNSYDYVLIINRSKLISSLGYGSLNSIEMSIIIDESLNSYAADIVLKEFPLKNIDKMRSAILGKNEIGETFYLGLTGGYIGTPDWNEGSGEDNTGYPYSTLFKRSSGLTWNAFTENGLVVKTYQSDLFNNWLNSEYVDGTNGISKMSAVDTSDGSFTMDSLILAERIYELLNRILVSGGTYQDWQEAAYGEGAVRICETPMYMGGMSAEIMFEEVISNSETKVDGNFQALGSLGGKGTQVNQKGGHNIHIKCDEPSYIIGIASITPRICYSQGNDWDMTELESIDDLHKPAMDGIGFQDLSMEQMAWWSSVINQRTGIVTKKAVGKQTAWINYQTAVDKCYGDFAKQDGYAFMVLNRNYEMGETAGTVKDITTYIDPSKYNYAFAYTDLAAQNFWVQIHSNIIARRKMGAQQIPNL